MYTYMCVLGKQIRIEEFGNIMRIDDSRLTTQIFEYLYKNKNYNQWIQGVKKDMVERRSQKSQ